MAISFSLKDSSEELVEDILLKRKQGAVRGYQ